MDTNNLVKLLLMLCFLHSSRPYVLGNFHATASLRSPKGAVSDESKHFSPHCRPQQQYKENGGMTRKVEQ